ncbi:AMMECR1-like protein [Coleophoma cylindrospora]|uniref:AMMECR1-like protein n=1 Tax=Coleophoma cylindrospora TaxID=1849047 RepID=A0A3D8RT82_9HELO|nr:AMMECR1-like protein [Coleophoma cylindrospora]
MATVEHCLYCFEALAASLEKRSPMTLNQVQTSWAEYPKGLEHDAEADAAEEDEEDAVDSSAKATSLSSPALRNPALSQFSSSSVPSSSSTSSMSLAPSTEASTPASSSDSFTPIGIGRRTSQRNESITESPLFVTWNTTSASSGFRNLRGCIGTFEAQELSSGLSSYALTSAFHDTRFSPIALRELPSLEVSVTLLTDFEQADDAMDWELGVHGLRISFYYRNRRHGSCYLPDVAPEQGWDKEETIISLMRKAGWGGKKDRWNEVGDLKVVRFQGKAESLDYAEFKAWRDWMEKEKEKK